MRVVDSFVPIEHIVPTLPGGTAGIVPTQLAGAAATTTTTTSTTTVCLSNLPADVDDTVLCQLVRPFGTVQSAHVLRGADDANTGRCATVTMSNCDEALRVLAAFNGRLLANCVVQATLSAPPPPHYAERHPASSLMTLQPVMGLVPTATAAAAGCQTLLLRNTALNGEMMMRQCLPQAYPAQTYELVQLPIM